MNINELSARAQIKQEIDALNSELSEAKKSKEELDYKLMTKLDEQGLSRTANDRASVSINNDTVPDVTDWDALMSISTPPRIIRCCNVVFLDCTRNF